MSKPNGRRVRMAQFQSQIAEAVLPPDGTVIIEIDDDTSVSIRIPITASPDDEYVTQIKGAQSNEEMALIVLGPEQWETWKNAGLDAEALAQVFTTESSAARERLRDFRYKG